MCGFESKKLSADHVINLDHGDPTMFEEYWQKNENKCTVTIGGSKSLSYFSNPKNFCWFLEPELGDEIKRLHKIVGNAVTDDRYILVGTGSTQLFQAALFALSSSDSSEPINVVSAAPYYSCYPAVSDLLKSQLHKWAGDALEFVKDEPYIEVVTSPNNPDGFCREPVVNRDGGKLIHDLAYYWPQYTAITSPADHDIMLFTISKSTGHAGSRIGWAIVKNKDVAEKMRKFIEVTTIGVSKESQLRATKILAAISDSCQNADGSEDNENFFAYGSRCMINRWDRLRSTIEQNGLFSLPVYPKKFCNFFGNFRGTYPAFAWLESKGEIEDSESYFKSHNILTRTGKFFGMNKKYVRVSMLDRDETFNILLERLSGNSSE
ncbi:L-tryptophan--pyruvate aminotransferase [Ranunculus cassubicifolius]